jgi:hypothetical protein
MRTWAWVIIVLRTVVPVAIAADSPATDRQLGG